MVFDFDSSSQYKELLLQAFVFAVENATFSAIHNVLAKVFSRIPMTNCVFRAITTTEHSSETTKKHGGVDFDEKCKQFGDSSALSPHKL